MRFTKFFIIGFILLFIQFSLSAQKGTPLRRPTSTTSPMWIIHIDTWNWADPEKIIDLVPEDSRPFVEFNVSLSVSDFVFKKYPFS
ncbi:MAG: glycoside hydrolase family 98 domain-containing protein, partial [Bacteroidales bacterium]|nr:glycoside hydrolase family 98 domain-containing protein [Bacteroidales bacterium]